MPISTILKLQKATEGLPIVKEKYQESYIGNKMECDVNPWVDKLRLNGIVFDLGYNIALRAFGVTARNAIDIPLYIW